VIEAYIFDVAQQMGIKSCKIELVDGQHLGCIDVYLITISTKNRRTDTLVFKSDLKDLEKGKSCYQLEVRTRRALSRLQ
jgi:hypothetical protein